MIKSQIRKVRIEEVIIIKELIGKGIEEDPYREIIVVYAKDGSFIAEKDPMEELQKNKEKNNERNKV